MKLHNTWENIEQADSRSVRGDSDFVVGVFNRRTRLHDQSEWERRDLGQDDRDPVRPDVGGGHREVKGMGDVHVVQVALDGYDLAVV